jgi:hypothetical protein
MELPILNLVYMWLASELFALFLLHITPFSLQDPSLILNRLIDFLGSPSLISLLYAIHIQDVVTPS